jgi:hypothetical protein
MEEFAFKEVFSPKIGRICPIEENGFLWRKRRVALFGHTTITVLGLRKDSRKFKKKKVFFKYYGKS